MFNTDSITEMMLVVIYSINIRYKSGLGPGSLVQVPVRTNF